MKITKKAQVVEHVRNGDYKKAFSISKSFNREFNSDEQRIIQIAYETMCGNDSIYKMMKIDTDKMIEDATELLNKYVDETI